MEDDSSTNLELRQSSSSKQTSTRSAPKPQRQESSTSNRKNSDSSAKSSIKRGLPSTASVRSGLEAGQTTRNGKDYYDEARRAVENQNRETFDTPVLESKPSNYLWLALFTTIFFNPLTGIVAMVMAIQADNEYIKGNSAKCKRLGKIVRVISIVSIALTIIIIAVVSIVFNI
ncbi:uncharacterized protein LOC125671943 [Ostrea edulis]|uniref:uncharacterized protein LOC125671943 n=1 Tax=Ostrea edulis TaxID=37623 RepID=UPI002095DF92|nr:uncharacterized protein LOC125671943 [Ostrea edulis]